MYTRTHTRHTRLNGRRAACMRVHAPVNAYIQGVSKAPPYQTGILCSARKFQFDGVIHISVFLLKTKTIETSSDRIYLCGWYALWVVGGGERKPFLCGPRIKKTLGKYRLLGIRLVTIYLVNTIVFKYRP